MNKLQVLLVCALFSVSLFSQAAEIKGSGEVSYGAFLDKKEKAQARTLAKQNAIEAWIAKKNPRHYSNYTKVKDEIDGAIDDYLLQTVTLKPKKNKGIYSVTVRVEINEPKLMAKLLEPSEEATMGQEEQFISFVFVAREQKGKVSRTNKSETIGKRKEQEIGKKRSENSATQSKEERKTINRSSEKTQLKDEVLWDVSTANEIDVAMGDVFTEAHYLVVDAGLLEVETGNAFSVEQFVEDYRYGNDYSRKTLSEAIQALKQLEEPVQYFAIGTLDIDEETIDATTGNVRVAVSITGQVLAVNKRGAAVAKVGPELQYGEGTTSLVAKNNALSLAAESVAKKLVAKLSARNIR